MISDELQKLGLAKENIHLQDALKCDYQDFCEEHFKDDNEVWLVSNLPYNGGSVIGHESVQKGRDRHQRRTWKWQHSSPLICHQRGSS